MAVIGGPKKPPSPNGRGTLPRSSDTKQLGSSSVSKQPTKPQNTKSGLSHPTRNFTKDGGGAQSGGKDLNQLREQLGSELLDRDALRGLSTQLLAEHLMILLAKKRAKQSRSKVLAEIGDLIIGLEQNERINKLLAMMPQVGRIVDIYPLEVLVYIMEKSPELTSKHQFRPFVRNRDELLSKSYEVGASIEIRVPLALKMRSFALNGGGNPGYVFAPGPPGSYFAEFYTAGSYSLFLRGEIHRVSHIDRLTLQIYDIYDQDA